jgi:pimeloyl-ACP methyl ester carboxylesterase
LAHHVDDIAAVMRDLKIERAHLVGLSIGAKLRSKARDSALSAVSGNPLTPDSRCPVSNALNG